MKRFSMLLVVTFVASVCYGYFYGYKLQISETQVQEKINAKLPYSKRYYMIFNVRLNDAKVKFRENKVRIQFNAQLEALNPEWLLKKNKMSQTVSLLSGWVDVMAIPEFRTQVGQVFLTEIKIVGVDIRGMKDSQKHHQLVRKLVTDYLETHPIYTIKTNGFKKVLAKKLLKTVTIRNNELELTFGI